VPVFKAELRTHKPILLYWLQMAAYQVAGVGQWGARLPSALLMLGTIVCTMLLSSRLLSHRFQNGRAIEHEYMPSWLAWNSPSMWSGIVLSTSLMIIVAGRAATPDSPLIFCSTLAITLLAYALTSSPQNYYRELFFIAGYIALGLGVLAKGPVGFILPFTVISAWFLWERMILQSAALRENLPQTDIHTPSRYTLFVEQLKTIAKQVHPKLILDYLLSTRLLIGIPIVLAVALPWYIWVGLRTDGVWLREFFWDHNVQRAVQSLEGHRGGPLYYPMASLVGLFPWSLWLAPFAVWLWLTNPIQIKFSRQLHHNFSDLPHNKRNSTLEAALTRLSFLWVAVFIGAFSCANTKLPSYITPCYPGAALIIGLFFSQLSNRASVRSSITSTDHQIFSKLAFKRSVGATLLCSVLGGIVASVALGIAAQQEAMPGVAWHGLWSLAISLAGLVGIGLVQRKQSQALPLCFATGAVICLTGWLAGGASSASGYRYDVAALIQQQQEHPERRWVAIGVLEPSWVFYTGHPIPEILITESENDPKEGWLALAIKHLENAPEHGIITLTPHADALLDHLQQTSSAKPHRYQIVRQEFPYFLRHQALVLITQQTKPLISPQTAKLPDTNIELPVQ